MKTSQFRYVSLSKRPLAGNKSKLKPFIPTFISSRKYTNYFQSPSRDDELLIKKKFIKLSKNGKSTSSFLSFISSINNIYSNTKKHDKGVINKTLKNNNYLILTSIENSSIVNSKEKKISYNSNNNSNNISLNKSRKKSNKKKKPESKYIYKNKNCGSSRTTTAANEKSKNNHKYSKTALNSKKNSKEKDKRSIEKLKTYKKNKDKRLNEIQLINTIKSNCNSYRISGKGGGGGITTTKGRIYPFSNKNILNSILSHLERPKNNKIHNNLNIRNIFDDYLKRAKDIKYNKKNKIKNISYNNYINNKKIKSPVNKNMSMNFKIPNLNIKSNYNNKTSYTAKVSPRCPLINFNLIYSKNKSKSKGKNSSYRSAKDMHSSSRRKIIKNNNYIKNINLNSNKYKNKINNINNLNIIYPNQNTKYISTYNKTKHQNNKHFITNNNNVNNIISTINNNNNSSDINNNINNNNINSMSNTFNLFHNIGGTMYNNYNININNQINNNVSYQNECHNNINIHNNNNSNSNDNNKQKEKKKNNQNLQNQHEIIQISKRINGKNKTANNSLNKNITLKLLTNYNGYINISIGKNSSSKKNKIKKNKIKKTKKHKDIETNKKNKSEEKIKNINNNNKTIKHYIDNYNNKSEDKNKEEKKLIKKNNENNNDNNNKENESKINNNSKVHDSSYYMRLSEKLSLYITNYFNKFRKYPNTSLSFYKYGRLIGQGAFGKVNLGLNILTGRVVAIKSFMKKDLEINGENMKKIIYETNLMKKLNHKNVTKILEMFEDKKYILIIMEYINGGNLFSFVKKRRKLSEKTAKYLFRQIIEGIKHIHENNIVHRDIKLENILIDVNNNVKICDFGIGKILSSNKELLYDQCGTPMYMAPEIFLSSKKKGYEGPPVDIWSSGIALYIMLSGTLPFDINQNNSNNNLNDINSLSSNEIEKNHNMLLRKVILNNEPKKIEKLSKEAKNLLDGLLNKNPKKRLTINEILNHPWLKDIENKKQNVKLKHHLFTKAELLIMSKTYIDYRKAKIEDLIENFTISNLIKNESIKNNNKNITTKSSILAPYNTLIQNEEIDSFSEEEKNDLFDDFNNKNILLEDNEIIGFNAKPKEFNMLYELNNNGEVDNGMLINSKTNTISSSNILNNSHYSNILIRNSFKENDDEEFNIHDMIEKEDKLEKKKDNVYNQMKAMGYEREYVKRCIDENILCHASVVYFLLMNYDN